MKWEASETHETYKAADKNRKKLNSAGVPAKVKRIHRRNRPDQYRVLVAREEQSHVGQSFPSLS